MDESQLKIIKMQYDCSFASEHDDWWSLAFTGHTNIEKCYGFKEMSEIQYNQIAFDKAYKAIKNSIVKFIEACPDGKTPRIIVGMARGVDEIAGLVAMDMGLYLVCCVPHSIRWHSTREKTDKGRVQALYYYRFFNYPKAIWFEIKKSYYPGNWRFANFARNAFMVDLSNKVVSFKCYDSTGTDHCIKYAKFKNKYAGNISKE